MTKEQLEHAAIILDVIAFFFVTIDLYGKERILHLSHRLRNLNVIESPGKIIFSLWANKIFRTIAIVGLLSWISLSIYDESKLKTEHFDAAYSYYVADVFVCLCLFLLLNVLFVFFVVIISYISLPIIKLIVRFFPIEGVMLTIGAILFLTSKTMAYLAV